MPETNSIAIPPRVKDLTGQSFARLTVLEFAGTRSLKAYWLCRCECGVTITLCGGSLTSGNSKSCGCLNRDTRTSHGKHRTPEYKAWQQILQRCCNPSSPTYPLYGGRGITACDRWRTSFVAFSEDMGLRPSPKHSIDRIDNDAGYCKENCRWATKKEQSRNTRQNVLVTFRGKTQCITAWAEELRMKPDTLQDRLQSGWSAERALTTPVAHRRSSASSAAPRL